MLENLYEGSNAKKCVWRLKCSHKYTLDNKVYFCEMYPTCVSSKLYKLIHIWNICYTSIPPPLMAFFIFPSLNSITFLLWWPCRLFNNSLIQEVNWKWFGREIIGLEYSLLHCCKIKSPKTWAASVAVSTPASIFQVKKFEIDFESHLTAGFTGIYDLGRDFASFKIDNLTKA